jgi:ketosteroid isomerase-like protein
MKFLGSMKTLAAFVLCAGLMQAGAQDDMVMKAMNDFATAVLKKDTATLKKLFADSVVYSHSSGKAETKAEAIEAIEKAKYVKFDYKEQKMQFFGNTAIVRGEAVLLNTATSPDPLKLSILQVWVKNPAGWQMVARQSTKLP